MKKQIITAAILALGATLYAKDIKEFTVTTTPPMRCQNCENRIKGNLRFEKGIKKIVTDIENQRVVITYDADKTNEGNIVKAFGKIDYQVEIIKENIDSIAPAAKSNK